MIDIETKQYQLDENRKYKPDDEPVKRSIVSREFLGYIPVMLRSNCCRLKVCMYSTHCTLLHCSVLDRIVLELLHTVIYLRNCAES